MSSSFTKFNVLLHVKIYENIIFTIQFISFIFNIFIYFYIKFIVKIRNNIKINNINFSNFNYEFYIVIYNYIYKKKRYFIAIYNTKI